ncbi:SMP-30/gluconolactonase/LRE family protein [Thalassococcus sp. S3]|uniref:SMP-30/gluconolactonase/LRE family protein n=1 Tax=Thalassococcus sp. S3 TaxID=2017482 RepID=UPI0010248F10|nr:SMP-30/gluconolactonase/LRE family protein [Thalassococcus sp. S3]QBF31133.1 strictosidine synthase [Thalassococcus sp. S3]
MRILALILLAGLAYLLFWPVDMDPVVYDPPEDRGFVAEYARNSTLSEAEFVTLPDGAEGPEDLAVTAEGLIYTTDLAGRLYRIEEDVPRVIDTLGGRPLGLDIGPDGLLYIADSYRGLMRWSGAGQLQLLANVVEGQEIMYANQLDVAADGTIYFSNSTTRFDPETRGGTKPTSVMAIWEQTQTGFVARRLPNGETEMVADGFVFANGVALSPNEEFLLVADSGRAQVHRIWLDGPRAGEREVFLDNLPGYPDNIEPMRDGTYWMAFASPRVPAEALMPYPFLRKVIWRLGPLVRPAPIEEGHMVLFDGDGQILASLQDPEGRLGITTGGRLVGDILYITTLASPGFGRLTVPE